VGNMEEGGPQRSAEGISRHIDSEEVEKARASMPATADLMDLADVFGLLGDPGRLRILIALLAGPMAVRDIASVVELSESAVSHALRLLRAHRVVDVTRDGRNAYYALADAHVRVLLELGLEHVGHTILLHPAVGSDVAHGPDHDHSHPTPKMAQ